MVVTVWVEAVHFCLCYGIVFMQDMVLRCIKCKYNPLPPSFCKPFLCTCAEEGRRGICFDEPSDCKDFLADRHNAKGKGVVCLLTLIFDDCRVLKDVFYVHTYGLNVSEKG